MSTMEYDTVKDYRATAERGAALLDEASPDWFLVVNPSELDMAMCLDCVLGQVYRSFDSGLECLDLCAEDAIGHGFDVADGLEPDDADEHYEILDRVWVDMITMRRLAGSAEETDHDHS